MSNAAIMFDREAYDAAGLKRPMGRNSAGEGFLKGFLRHADVERIYLWNHHNRHQRDLEPLLRRLGPPGRPVSWIEAADRPALADAGALYIPTPELQGEAWARRAVGATAYSLTGVTHTIAETYIMEQMASLLTAPLEPWDALICTSAAAKRAVETQLGAVSDYLQDRLGATRMPPAQLVTIPLGVHAADFAPDPAARKAWRAALDIPQDALVALFFGRFSVGTKMNPAPMGLALQEAARRVDKPVYWLLFGGGRKATEDAEFRAAAAAFCPDVTLKFTGDLEPDAYGPVWSAADVFLSLSDNIQETFGLTPLEAMAAGLPCVVSDWDGYRDTVRHGVDGFRIRTTTPRPGLGADLAYRYAHGMSPYPNYAGTTAQFTAVDVEAAAEALTTLFMSPDLRARMGREGRARALGDYDWRVVIAQYQELWAELDRRRRAAPAQGPRPAGENPWGMDPFTMFESFPTGALAHTGAVRLPRRFAEGELTGLLARPSVRDGGPRLPTLAEAHAIVGALSPDRDMEVGALVAGFPPERRPFIERGLVWLAKFGLVRLSGGSPQA
jgi:glycosyltransferase involved in cell wall biosynthesis